MGSRSAEFVRTRRTESTTSAPSGMSRQQLAAAIHSSIGYVAKIEQGDAHCPSPGVLDALAVVFIEMYSCYGVLRVSRERGDLPCPTR
ncbi:helix-turn-helix domain-containing protein [Nocardia transvalensis]|uniref:helix-turn-helix domain-containing protein n=1 Tax=Nocardia transvalensis TaxID=37333 RepID=UPI00189484F6|nr:helix-turn-helix domain-containing protein [Nocardia transvalensis]